jgi:ATP-dependent DNA ligase
MELDKRNFTDFDKFPGKIESNGIYKFPSLYHIDHNKNTRIWTINIRLTKGIEKYYDIDWDLMNDNIVPVKPCYLINNNIPAETNAQIYVETGVISGKITRHSPTYSTIKNKGKSNERNKFEQALVMARTLYLKKIDSGSRTKKEFGKHTKKQVNIKYFPMLVRKYDDEKKHLHFPLYVQPKLDGARCIAFLNKSPRSNPTYKNVIMYTRQKNDYLGFDKIRKELLSALIDMWDFSNKESIYIDGELYKHGLSLQDISGAVRNPERTTMDKYKGIKFHVFDIFYPKQKSLIFKDRLSYIDDFFDALEKNSECVIKVQTDLAKTDKEQDSMYKKFLSKKYEGIILRNSDSEYLTHPTKNSRSIRSKYVLKRKMTYDDEFEVVGFKEGIKGHDKGAIIWICKTHNTNKTFSAPPKNITYDERYKLFELASKNDGKGFDKLYKGRMMTVEYEDLSKSEVPLRAKAIGFREHI